MTDSTAIDYVLGELDGPGRTAAERRLRDDPGFRAEVERLSPVVARLEALPREGWEALEPPPLRMPADAARTPSPRRARRLVLRPAIAVAASLALVGAGVAGGVVAAGGGGDGDKGTASSPIALSAVDAADPGARGKATVVRDGESAIRLSLDGLAPNGRGDAYEAWLMDGPERLVSLGSFRVGPSGSATVTLPVPAAPGRYRFVDVSRERLDGDPGHSGTSVLRGPTRA